MTNILSYKFIDNHSENTILFLHGWGCNKQYMFPLSHSNNYNSLIIDLPGFGDNPKLSYPYHLNDFVEDILLFINTSNLKINYIVGHSFGGKLACRLSNFIKIKGLILISASSFHKIRGPLYYIKVLLYKLIKKFRLFKKITNKMGSKDYKDLSPIMKKTMSNIINEPITKDIKKIIVPTILLYGNNDKITPLCIAKKTKKHIKDCELIILKGNHFAYLYNKTQVIKIIESLVSST